MLQEAQDEKLRRMSPQDREKYEAKRKKIEQERKMRKRTIKVSS